MNARLVFLHWKVNLSIQGFDCLSLMDKQKSRALDYSRAGAPNVRDGLGEVRFGSKASVAATSA